MPLNNKNVKSMSEVENDSEIYVNLQNKSIMLHSTKSSKKETRKKLFLEQITITEHRHYHGLKFSSTYKIYHFSRRLTSVPTSAP